MTEEHRGGASAAEADRVGGNELVVTGDCTKMADGEGLGERCFLRDRIDVGLAGVFGGMRGPRELGRAGGCEAGGIGGGVRTLDKHPGFFLTQACIATHYSEDTFAINLREHSCCVHFSLYPGHWVLSCLASSSA